MANSEAGPSTQVSSSDRCEPGSFALATATLPDLPPSIGKPGVAIAMAMTSRWIESFNKRLCSPAGKWTAKHFSNHFLAESYWRDILCLTWNFRTLHHPEGISSLFRKFNGKCCIESLELDQTSTRSAWPKAVVNKANRMVAVEAYLVVKTSVGIGEGFVQLKELRDHEELVGKNRQHGAQYSGFKDWFQCRQIEEKFEDDNPTVLIIGAGQAGLTIAARLKMLGVKSLIIDRNHRAGSSWRQRYDQLFLHGPVWLNHMPYMPFPEGWPIFTPKDKFADWLDLYAKTMELNIWGLTTVKHSSWDDKVARWDIDVVCQGFYKGETETLRTLHPKHVILATGSGKPFLPPNLDLTTFEGPVLHSSEFRRALSLPPCAPRKPVTIVGSGNSAHDIAQNYCEKGWAVTMVQRSSTFVISSDANLESLAPRYGPDSPSTDDSDIAFFGIPNPVAKRMGIDARTEQQESVDKELIAGLDRAGFKLNNGPDGSGLWITYLQKGGGFCIDTGCSKLIIDGHIMVKSGEITEILPRGVKFADNKVLEAEEIVFATGYKTNMRDQCREIFGDKVANRVNDVWGFDEEGEIRTMWRKSGHPGFWFMGGNLILCRFYSRALALQIKALLEGICKYDDL